MQGLAEDMGFSWVRWEPWRILGREGTRSNFKHSQVSLAATGGAGKGRSGRMWLQVGDNGVGLGREVREVVNGQILY